MKNTTDLNVFSLSLVSSLDDFNLHYESVSGWGRGEEAMTTDESIIP